MAQDDTDIESGSGLVFKLVVGALAVIGAITVVGWILGTVGFIIKAALVVLVVVVVYAVVRAATRSRA
jgi:hypothetical protein